jgi:hypothetical protein
VWLLREEEEVVKEEIVSKDEGSMSVSLPLFVHLLFRVQQR